MLAAPAHAWFRLLSPGLVELVFPERTSDAELHRAFRELERWMRDDVHAPYGFLVRIDHVLMLTSKQRQIVAGYEARYADVERRFNAGQAMVVASPVQRGLFTAFTWLSPLVWPYRVFGDTEAALQWLRAHWADVTHDYPTGPRWMGRLRGDQDRTRAG